MTCTYDIRRGDWLWLHDVRYRITRYDNKNETIVATDGASTIVLPLVQAIAGHARLERQTRSPMEIVNEPAG